ncbi:MAG: hypothetical protein IPP71_18395 [Bacteroidetes bacterium]|nr:hypothetical protein [Bacteroidota bacterium]
MVLIQLQLDFVRPMNMPNDTLPSNGVNQIFITKFNASGNQIWDQSLKLVTIINFWIMNTVRSY